MTPKAKTATSTVLLIERKKVQKTTNDKVHVAGGDHTGIVINKEVVTGELGINTIHRPKFGINVDRNGVLLF